MAPNELLQGRNDSIHPNGSNRDSHCLEYEISCSCVTEHSNLQFSNTTCADFCGDSSLLPYANTPQPNLRTYPQPHENFPGKHYQTTADGGMFAITAKRRRLLRQSPPASEKNNSPPSSIFSSPSTVAIWLENEEEVGGSPETRDTLYDCTKPIYAKPAGRLDTIDMTTRKTHVKVGGLPFA